MDDREELTHGSLLNITNGWSDGPVFTLEMEYVTFNYRDVPDGQVLAMSRQELSMN